MRSIPTQLPWDYGDDEGEVLNLVTQFQCSQHRLCQCSQSLFCSAVFLCWVIISTQSPFHVHYIDKGNVSHQLSLWDSIYPVHLHLYLITVLGLWAWGSEKSEPGRQLRSLYVRCWLHPGRIFSLIPEPLTRKGGLPWRVLWQPSLPCFFLSHFLSALG